MSDTHDTIDRVARTSYGRLLAYLAVRTRDLGACEDALSDAFVQALRSWPERGIPRDPDAWLRTVARNGLVDRMRHQVVLSNAALTLRLLSEERGEEADERLPLLFVCAHPAIDAAARAPLMMQVVLGMEAATIAPAFLLSPASMAKRLVRAKEKIRRAGMGFELPAPDEWAPRLDAVLDAIYGAYGRAWDHGIAHDAWVTELRHESITLAELIVARLPDEPEALALLALMRYCEARASARTDDDGVFVPLREQDTARWDRGELARAEALLHRAAARATPGRFQLEAAIQSCHVARRLTGEGTVELLALYDTLVARYPTVGAALARIAAVAESRPDDALQALDAATFATLTDHQPYWSVRADVLARLGRHASACEAYERALGLTADPRVRRWLARRRDALSP